MDPTFNLEKLPNAAPPGVAQTIPYAKTPQLDTNAQVLLAIQNMTQKMEEQKNEYEKQRMRDEIERLKEKNREVADERNREIGLMNMHVGLHNLSKGGGGTNINVNNNNNNNNNNGVGTTERVVIVSNAVHQMDGRLEYDCGMYCLILLLNIFLPGVGTILAGILYGNSSKAGDRTGNVICHGIAQLIFAITIFGWVWAIRDALYRFAYGSCPMCACFD